MPPFGLVWIGRKIPSCLKFLLNPLALWLRDVDVDVELRPNVALGIGAAVVLRGGFFVLISFIAVAIRHCVR